ncbi:nuclear transport factor 2 family protein [Mycobacterium crocinum]|uniref:Nuclear transport factor 2 family protein n=1 Tax=Mycolicibacterium crocinum TaxID=388459 RepID=A0ABY3TE05_9MYCO|nr:nuclear transport factor 2 family protein [Mycolicibacterium crocinum]MCV7218687.1 nuclear transport factor 2 family protein [Mycolicibacterium crocinum]ULN39170.1 nuclear transport factor 2 family protein [Mycolicibacterium crocinum]
MDIDSLTLLLDERAIERALIAFARAMDERDWSSMERILADDAEGDFGTGRVVGRSAVINLVRGYLDTCGVTQHLLGNVVIDVSGDRAVSRAYVRDVHLDSTNDPATRMYTLGDYRDAWRRTADGSWSLIERVKINRGFVGTLEVFEEKSS